MVRRFCFVSDTERKEREIQKQKIKERIYEEYTNVRETQVKMQIYVEKEAPKSSLV